MPFRMIVRSVQSESSLDFPNDSDRQRAEEIIAEFRSGELSMDGVFSVPHSSGVFRRRWADIRDMWIEEAS